MKLLFEGPNGDEEAKQFSFENLWAYDHRELMTKFNEQHQKVLRYASISASSLFNTKIYNHESNN